MKREPFRLSPFLLPAGLALLLPFVWPAAAGAQNPVEVQATVHAASTLFRGAPPDQFSMRRSGSGEVVVRDGRIRQPYSAGGALGVRLIGRTVAEAVVLWSPAELTAGEGLGAGRSDADIYSAALNLLFLLPSIDRVEPYLTFGLGRSRLELTEPGLEPRTDFLWSWGPGATVALTDRIGLRMDLRDEVTAFDPGMDGLEREPRHHLMLLFGLAYRTPLR